MGKMTTRACLLAYALAIVSCSGNPQSTASPSGALPTSASANADGSRLKVTEPRDLGPNGVVVSRHHDRRAGAVDAIEELHDPH